MNFAKIIIFTALIFTVSVIVSFDVISNIHANSHDPLLRIDNPTPASYDRFGYSVASTIYGDIIVGESFGSNVISIPGAAYLFDGDLRGTTNAPLLTINNPTPGEFDYFGHSVASTNSNDILVGAPGDSNVVLNTGAAYLFDGDLRGTTSTPLLTINNPTTLEYPVGDRFGHSVTSTNSDDIIIGAPGDSSVFFRTGSVYLFDGELRGTTSTPLLTINNPDPNIPESRFGHSVASTSTGDIIVGEPSNDIIIGESGDDTSIIGQAGSVYLFDGELRGTTSIPLLTIDNPNPEPEFFFDRLYATNYFGLSVASTSTGDIIVGAVGSTDSVYLFDGDLRGTTSTPLLTINNPHPELDDNFGLSVASTSTGDIIVGAPGYPTSTVYLFDGDLRGTTSTPLLTINNPTPASYDRFGYSVASTVHCDIIVGTPGNDSSNEVLAGSVYLFDGINGRYDCSEGPEVVQDIAITKQVSPGSHDGDYYPGDTITWTVTSENVGTGDADSFRIEDIFRVSGSYQVAENIFVIRNLTFEDVVDEFTFEQSSGTDFVVPNWNISGLDVNSSVELTLITILDQDECNYKISNTATAQISEFAESNNSDSESIHVKCVPSLHYVPDIWPSGAFFEFCIDIPSNTAPVIGDYIPNCPIPYDPLGPSLQHMVVLDAEMMRTVELLYTDQITIVEFDNILQEKMNTGELKIEKISKTNISPFSIDAMLVIITSIAIIAFVTGVGLYSSRH